MAEFEQGYCTGCGYKVLRWGHRPYCWRVVCHQLAHVDPTTRTVVLRCLKQMRKYHRFVSLLLCRKKHMYYTVESIELCPESGGAVNLTNRKESESERLASRSADILKSIAKKDPKHNFRTQVEWKVVGNRYIPKE